MAIEDEEEVSTAAKIVRGLDVVLFELQRMDDLWLDAPRDWTNTSIIHEARRRTRLLLDATDSYMSWMAAIRLDPPTN